MLIKDTRLASRHTCMEVNAQMVVQRRGKRNKKASTEDYQMLSKEVKALECDRWRARRCREEQGPDQHCWAAQLPNSVPIRCPRPPFNAFPSDKTSSVECRVAD